MSAGAGSHDSKNGLVFVILFLIISVCPWALVVPHVFTIPKGELLRGYYYSLLATPKSPVLLVAAVFGFVLAFVVLLFVSRYTRTNFEGARFHQKLRGSEFISHAKLSRMFKASWWLGYQQLFFCGVPVPKAKEDLHFGVCGSTGSGKTVVISAFIESALLRKSDRIFCIDPDGGFMRYFFQKGDVVLNPFDVRGLGWSIFNEIRTKFDCQQYAVTMIPRAPSDDEEVWCKMARVIVSQTLIKIWLNSPTVEKANQDLFHWLIDSKREELHEFLAGTPAAGMFDAVETFNSIRTVLTQYIQPHEYLGAGNFSFRKFIESNKGNIWITWTEDQLTSLKPLISCWADVISISLLSLPDAAVSERNKIAFVTDELDSLEKLNYYEDLLTKGRKKGVTVLAGFQSLAQIDETYGDKGALTLRNSFSNTAVCQIAKNDNYTAEQYSKIFGTHEVTRYNDSLSVGTGGGRGTRALQKEIEPLILPSQISGLDALTFYFSFAHSKYICKHTMPYKTRKPVTDGFVLAKNQWTKSKEELRATI